MSLINEEWAEIADVKVENMSDTEAAYYFLCFWLIWPFMIMINFPLAVIFSPILIIRALFKLGEWFIIGLLNGKEINRRVDDADDYISHHYHFST